MPDSAFFICDYCGHRKSNNGQGRAAHMKMHARQGLLIVKRDKKTNRLTYIPTEEGKAAIEAINAKRAKKAASRHKTVSNASVEPLQVNA